MNTAADPICIGILGAGQLARMLALAAYPLGITTLCLSDEEKSPAHDMTSIYRSEDTANFLAQINCLTLETENIPVSRVESLAEKVPLYPSTHALKIAQDRYQEKTFLNQLGIPTPQFFLIDSEISLTQACEATGFPCILKTRYFGYDGKGQFVLRSVNDIATAWETLGAHPLILEAFVPFDRELSLIAARDKKGNLVYYPLTQNYHDEGILRVSFSPAVAPTLQKEAEDYLEKIMTALNYVGVLAVEFFDVDGKLVANEMAPRVHNSGHWTIEGAQTSQFEQHIRAIADLPLGSTAARGYSVMLNCIGTVVPLEAVLSVRYAHYHDYQKAPKPGRKLAHVTVNAPDKLQLRQALEQLAAKIPYFQHTIANSSILNIIDQPGATI